MGPNLDQDDSAAERLDMDAWRQIDDRIAQVARMSRADVSEAEFYALLLDNAVRAGLAQGGLVWDFDGSSGPQVVAECRLLESQLLADPEIRSRHLRFLQSVCERPGVRWVSCDSGNGPRLPHSEGGVLFAGVVPSDDRTLRIVEVLQRPELSADACQGYAAVLATLCDLAGNFQQQAQRRQLQAELAVQRQIEDFVAQVHEQLETESVASCIANEGRRLAGCDRLIVLVRRHGRFRVLAVSGLDQAQARANPVRSLERLVEKVLASGQPLWYGGPSEQLPPEVEFALREYLDLSHVRTVVVLPLGETMEPSLPARVEAIGALVLETFPARTFDDAYRWRLAAIQRHSHAALRNAERYSRLPLVGWLEAGQSVFRGAARTWRYLLAGACLLMLTSAACLVPADFDIVCQGTAQPLARRQVFAPVDGLVQQVHVRHGENVAAAQTLVTLRSPDLALEATQILGEMQTVQQQLTSLNSARLSTTPGTIAERDEAARLAADEQRLLRVAASLKRRQRLLDDELDRLNVRAPIGGQVLTWEVERRLQARPVERGQLLMTIGDIAGPWILELRIVDRDVLPVREARRAVGRDLAVTFVPASEPGRHYRGTLEEIALRMEPDANQRLSVLATVQVEPDSRAALRPGAGVTARIHCGRRAVGYVWLRDLIVAVRRWLFL